MKTYVKNWGILLGHTCLVGEVYDSKKFEDGSIMRSSKIVNIEKENNEFKISTLNSIYYVNIKDMSDNFKEYLEEIGIKFEDLEVSNGEALGRPKR